LRELSAKEITENVAEMCKEAAYYLPNDVYEGLKKGRETEESPVGKVVLDQIIRNAEIAREADILVAAVGRPRFVTADMVKPGATVIDVGINRIAPKQLVGDVDFDAAAEVAGAITPVPGGVGLLTVAMLMENVVQAAKAQNA